jgi:hypothetical protein
VSETAVRPSPRRLGVTRPSARTFALLVLGYALSRLLTTGLLAAASALSAGGHWSAATIDGGDGFAKFLQAWDGNMYRRIVTDGYPGSLPLDYAGDVEKNPWAFLPLYPLLVRGLMAVGGLGFLPAGVLVAVVCGGGATLLLHRVLLQQFGERSAFWGALFFCFSPLSFVLQVTYAESTFLLFVFGSLLALQRRRYAVLTVLGVIAAFAHPGALAIPAALGVGYLLRLARREWMPAREHSAIITSGILMSLAGFAWPVVAAVTTRTPGAYFDTEMAWWSDYLGSTGFVPFTPWFRFAQNYLGLGGTLLVVAVLAAVAWCFAFRSRRLGTDLLAYSASYVVYLVAVFLPQQSIFRMLLPLSPLLGQPALSRTPRRAAVTLGVSIALQPVGIALLWMVWPP